MKRVPRDPLPFLSRLSVALYALGGLLVDPAAAQTTVDYHFVASVFSDPSPDPARFPLGTEVFLTLSVPVDAQDQDIDPSIGEYGDVTVQLANDRAGPGAVSAACDDGDLSILDDFLASPMLPPQDLFTGGSASCDAPIASVAVSLNNTGAIAFDSDAIPASPIDLAPFDGRSVTIAVTGTLFPVLAVITAVPEPGHGGIATVTVLLALRASRGSRRHNLAPDASARAAAHSPRAGISGCAYSGIFGRGRRSPVSSDRVSRSNSRA